MRTGDRKVAEDEAQAVPHLRLDLLECGVGGAAIGAFVVAVFHQRDWCAIRSLDVVSVRRDGHGQLNSGRRAFMTPPPVRPGPRALEESHPHLGSLRSA